MNKKLLILSAGVLTLFASQAFAGCTSVTENGIRTETCTTLWSGPVVYTYDANDNMLSYISYDKNNVPTNKGEFTYDSDGNNTSGLWWNSPEAVANNTPDSKEERVYDGSTVYYIEYYSNESIVNNAPDSKSGYTYDENGYEVSRIEWYYPESVANNAPDYKAEYGYDENGNQNSYTEWRTAEAVANNTPDYKQTYQYNAEQNMYMYEYYNNSESIANNAPDVHSFYLGNEGRSVAYDKNGNLLLSPWDNVVIYDEQGRVIRSGASECLAK